MENYRGPLSARSRCEALALIIAIRHPPKRSWRRGKTEDGKLRIRYGAANQLRGKMGIDYTGQALITHRTRLQSSRFYRQDRRRRYSFATSSPNSATTGLYIVHPICCRAISAEIRCRLVRSRGSSARLIGLRGTPTLKKGLRSRGRARERLSFHDECECE